MEFPPNNETARELHTQNIKKYYIIIMFFTCNLATVCPSLANQIFS